jgi:hypothetical protein
MLKPTQDNELKKKLSEIFVRYSYSFEVEDNYDNLDFVKEALELMEKLGYHTGLPTSAEEALNSGDGVYRP